jgi:hypothetical protein
MYYLLNINAHMEIKENTADTIMLQTERIVGVLPAVIKIYDDHNVFYDTITQIARMASHQPIPIKTHRLKSFKLEINYAALSGSEWFMEIPFDNHPKVLFFHTPFGGNILPNPVGREISYKDIYFKDIPDNFLSFSSFTPNNHDNTLDITFVDISLYSSKNYEANMLNVNIYFPDTISMNNFEAGKEKFFESLLKLNYYEKKTIDIIVAYLSIPKLKAAFGRAINEHIFCDTSFISGTQLTHEILHVLYPIKADKHEGQFFVGESTIEWLTHYVMYGTFKINEKSRDRFNPQNSKSLYSLTINDANSMHVVYNWGPDCIQNLANETNPDKLFQVIINFFRHYKHQTVSYQQFLDWLHDNLPKEEVDNLDKCVKHEFN